MTNDNTFSLEINDKYTRMAEVKHQGNTIELVTMGFEQTVPLYFTSENQSVVDKQVEVISRLHSNLKIKKRNAHIIIPDMYTFSRVVEMPRLKEKELLAAIRYQADEFIPMAIDDTNLDLEVLKDDEKTNKMLIFIVASPKKLIDQVQKTVELADLVPEVLESELSAVSRLMSEFFHAQQQVSGTTILLNFGYNSSSLYLFDASTSTLLLSRSFKIGVNIFIKDLMVNLNIDEAKATEILTTLGANADASANLDVIIGPIIKEISKEVERFVLISKEKYGMPVNQIFIFNFDTSIAGISTRLQQGLAQPVTSLTLNDVIVDSPIKQSFSGSMSSFISVISGNL